MNYIIIFILSIIILLVLYLFYKYFKGNREDFTNIKKIKNEIIDNTKKRINNYNFKIRIKKNFDQKEWTLFVFQKYTKQIAELAYRKTSIFGK